MRIVMCGVLVLTLAVSWTAFAVSADKAAAKEKADVVPYPLDTCLVTGEKLGSMGTPISQVFEGQEIKFCCSGCPEKFKADPKKYLKKLEEGIVAQQKPTYPLDTCIVMGDKLGEKPIEYVYKGRLVRLCCEECIKTFNKDPKKYLKMIDDAAAAKGSAGKNAEAPKDDKKK